jgi:hypothetical protein
MTAGREHVHLDCDCGCDGRHGFTSRKCPGCLSREQRIQRLEEALRDAPPLLGVWNVEGRRFISEEFLSAFVDAYNAWADIARTALSEERSVNK